MRFDPDSGDKPERSRFGEAVSVKLAHGTSEVNPRLFWALVGFSVILGLLVRAPFLGTPGFPLGEGGLFAQFSQSISEAGFRLPHEVAYGSEDLPFAYPPLAFYLAALVMALFDANVGTVLYWLPILLNVLGIPVFCALAVNTLRNRTAVIGATILYAVLLHSFLWQLTGGGLPRSLAALFAMGSVALALRMKGSSPLKAALLTGPLIGLAILSHLEWGILAASGVTLAALFNANLRRGFVFVCLTAIISAMVIAPWLVTVILRHGLEPFFSSSTSSEWNPANTIFLLLTGTFAGLLVWPAAVGGIVLIKRKEPFLLLWIPIILLLTPRMGLSAGVTIPVALVAGLGISAIAAYWQKLIEADPNSSQFGRTATGPGRLFGLGMPALVILIVMVGLLSSALRTGTADISTMTQLTTDERAGMTWVRQHTPPESQFVIISEGAAWWADREAEWFPVLAGRESRTTAQGLEWAGPGVFTAKKEEIAGLKALQRAEPSMLPIKVLKDYCGSYIAVFMPSDAETRKSVERFSRFEKIYSNKGAAILRPRASPAC